MRLVLLPEVWSDINSIMEYYENVAGPKLADDFYRELRKLMIEATERPESFAIRIRNLRRANLRRFPYHFLFRIIGNTVRVLVVRHHRSAPSTGMQRR